MRQIQTILISLFLMMSLSNSLTAQQLTEREQKIKQIYDSKIEQIITNCTANSIMKDGINADLRDSLSVTKVSLSSTRQILTASNSKANKYKTLFFISLVVVMGLCFIVFKLLPKTA